MVSSRLWELRVGKCNFQNTLDFVIIAVNEVICSLSQALKKMSNGNKAVREEIHELFVRMEGREYAFTFWLMIVIS